MTSPTIDSWLSILEESYILYFPRPDYNNFSKRLVKSPKLYFYDTGLACSLLEIRDTSQLASHYLRGGLFENLVINEFHKRNYNRGMEPSFSFWHDSTGYEVDLLRTESNRQYGFEIKSGATFSKEFFKGLNHWGKLSGAGQELKTVIYGGDKPLKTSDGNVLPWRNM